VGVDRPDDGEMPPDEHPDRPPDRNENGSRPGGSGGAAAETRSYEEYYVQLSAAAAAEKIVAARATSAEEQAAAEKWDEQKVESRWMWGEHQRRFPAAERPQVDRSDDPKGSWRGEGGRYLAPEQNTQVEAACDRVVGLEREKISPAMLAVESQDPERHLVGFDHRRKGGDRIKEKVCDKMEEFGFSTEEAVSRVSDAIRFTFQYREGRYTQGVWEDIGRLRDRGFQLHTLKNSWSSDQYKGINSQWIDQATGQRFEVQFHTRISFEAKQLTHDAYKRIRSAQRPDEFEKMVLKAFQRKVSDEIPVPPGAADILDYSERGADAR
jgi:hypothetical protein